MRDTGAAGNGVANDTAAIQAAVDQVAGTGGTVFVPNGTYMIDATKSVKLKSKMTLKLDSGAILKAIPNAAWGYSIVLLADASNVNIVGGTIWGERHQHLQPGDFTGDDLNGQWGYGISIWGGTNNYVEGVLSRECWGDGFYLDAQATNVFFFSVVADDNRRQGMSIVDATGVVIRGSTFKNTRGAPPQSGIDIEPDSGKHVDNVQIFDSFFTNNNNQGVELYAAAGPVTRVVLDGNTLTGNNHGIELNHTSGNSVTNNTIVSDYGLVFDNATGNNASGNRITYGTSCIFSGGGNTLTSNTCTHQ